MGALILVDSCVLIDVIESDPHWADWSIEQLDRQRNRAALAINLVIYAEIAKSFDRMERLDQFVDDLDLAVIDIPRTAAWDAANVHLAYRRNRGAMSVTLPDFFIGAHAIALDCPILTRDARRFSTYFPRVGLITPE